MDFGETYTMPQRLSEPETCVYYQVAEFYHNMSLSVKTVSPAFFDLLEGYCLAVWRAYDQESEPYLEAVSYTHLVSSSVSFLRKGATI